MYQYRGFDELKVGQRLKVKGTPGEGDRFMALEISVKEQKDQAEVEGAVQSVDAAGERLRVANMEFSIPASVVVKNGQKLEIGLGDLKPGEFVKVKGLYHPKTGFVVEKVKGREDMGFGVEELQGNLDSIDPASHTFRMIGVQVVVTEKTSIEGMGD